MPGGPRSSGIDLDPLVGLDNERTPLRSKLLAVPALKARYLSHVRTIAETWLDWKTLGPIVERDRALIEQEIKADTRKLSSFVAFQKSVSEADEPAPAPGAGPGRGRREMSLKAFADGRRRKRLARLTEALGQQYERIILDCPPVMNALSAQIVRAADLVIVPLPPSPLSARALDLVVREVADHSRRHPPILPVLSMLDMRRALHKQAREENPAWPAIPYASAVEQCAVLQRPVGAIAPHSSAAQRFIGLWRAIERKLDER